MQPQRVLTGVLALSIVLIASASARSGCASPPGPPLVAHWTFDEAEGPACSDAAGGGHEARLAAASAGGIPRTEGLFGNALLLSGQHRLAAAASADFAELAQLSFSAWVKPTRLDRYNEIFRKEDGNRRLLFSFQDNGTILSLGLNVGGYVECDAPIRPEQVLDGLWHHCAASFDGRTMRVYLDGRQIGSLERPGAIACGGEAPACIGSSSGNECFQGALDDLRVYRAALSGRQVRQLYTEGETLQRAKIKELEQALAEVYVRRETFAETLAAARRRAVEDGVKLAGLRSVLGRRVSDDFPQASEQFVSYSGLTPAEYIAGDEKRFRLAAERLIGLLLEYRPITDSQWLGQTDGDRRRWAEADAIRQRYDRLVSAGEAARFSPQWIELILAAGARVEFRPSAREAVAPYVPPATPATRDLTAEEAEEALRRDWLHQADGHPTAERILEEIGWTRQLAERIAAEYPGRVDFSHPLAAIGPLEARARSLRGEDADLYFAVRRLKRSIVLANPLLDFDRVLMVDMPFPQGSEWRHQTRHRLGYMAMPGGRLVVLEGLAPGGRLRQLMPQAPLHGSFWRPDVSYDGRTVLFCFKPHNEKAFHLYEINADGTGLRQLTSGPYDDLDPIYLPDGEHILFSTTRGHSYVRCMPPTNAFVLARAKRSGSDIYLVSTNNEPDYLPSVMDDGRVLYTRWEYTDKPLWRAQALWTVNPDGTGVAAFWGNQSVWPDLLKDGRNIPGSRRVMFTGSAHHDWFAGSVGILDPDKGYNFPDGLTKVTAEVAWPESGNGPVDPIESARYHASGRYAAYYSPYPLSERDFLVSAERSGKFVLYLMDTDGNRELVHEGANHILHAIPLRPRARPPVIADRVAWPERGADPAGLEGLIYSANVLHGAPEALRGRVRYLRVLAIEPKTYTYWNQRPYLSTGPVVSAVQSEGVKRILGTVPIQPDGSVAFRAPAGQSLHFQLLDENQRALQTMRSFTGVLPGERRGCLGCHELHSTAPELPRAASALSKEPRSIEPPPWDDDSVSYDRYVRPVLDRVCGRCHQGDGEGRKTFDMTPRTGFLFFDETYLTLIGRPTWGQTYSPPESPPPGFGIACTLLVEAYDTRDPAAYQTPQPMQRLSYASRLVEIASSGTHHDVRVDPIDLLRLIVWVDAICPYRGAEEIRAIDDPQFPGIDWLSIRPRIKTAPRIARPGPVD